MVKEILQSKAVDAVEWYKVHWGGYVKRGATWGPAEHLTGRSADALVTMMTPVHLDLRPYLD